MDLYIKLYTIVLILWGSNALFVDQLARSAHISVSIVDNFEPTTRILSEWIIIGEEKWSYPTRPKRSAEKDIATVWWDSKGGYCWVSGLTNKDNGADYEGILRKLLTALLT